MVTTNVSLAEACALVRERSAEVDRSGRFSRENWELLRDSGLTGLAVPARFGGREAGVDEMLRTFRQVGGACPSTGLGLLMHTCATAVITATGSWRSAVRNTSRASRRAN